MNQQTVQLQQQVTRSWQDALRYIVDHNPRAVYDLIRKMWPTAITSWAPGFEKTQTSRNKMYEVLYQQAAASANPGAWVLTFGSEIPYNPAQNNYTKH